MVVVGGGYIGMELASVFAKLGTDVTVVEMLDSILPGYDDDLTRPVKQRAEALGIDFHFGYTASEWYEPGDGIRVVAEPVDGAAANGGSTEAIEAERLELDVENVLVAVGRSPVSETLDLEEAGIETDDRGFIETDSRARTNVDHIFAVGDVAGEPMLAHKRQRGRESRRRGDRRRARGPRPPGDPRGRLHRPRNCYRRNDRIRSRRSWLRNGDRPVPVPSQRPRTDDRRFGRLRKIVAADEDGYVLGASIVGPEASELIAELGLAIELGATLEDVAATVHAHPTLSESVMEAAENALGHAIHTLNR